MAVQSIYSRLFVDRNIYDQRIIYAMLIAFAGILRSSESLQIRFWDVKFEPTYIKTFLEQSKTDQYRDGAWIIISRTGTSLCPVQNSKLYVAFSSILTFYFVIKVHVDLSQEEPIKRCHIQLWETYSKQR